VVSIIHAVHFTYLFIKIIISLILINKRDKGYLLLFYLFYPSYSLLMKTLLDADYIIRDEESIIRLFYKTDNGREIEEITDFQPYFYVTPSGDIDKLADELKAFTNIIAIEKKQMLDRGVKREILKVTVKQPKNVPSLRENIKELKYCDEVREADIPFAHRYIIDSGLIPMENCEKLNLRIAAVDIEVYNPKREPRSDRDPIIMISYADNLGLRRVWSTKGENLNLDYIERVNSEPEMIKRLIQTIKEREIDIIVTYNGDNFDFPYLRDRCSVHKIEFKLGIDGSNVKLERRGMKTGARVRGRPHVDLFPICRQIFNLPRYRLEDVYLELFGKEKVDIQTMKMYEIWDSDDENKHRTIFEYSMSDAESTLRIADVLLPLQYELSRIVRLPVYECSRTASGQRVEHLLIREAYNRNIIVPNKPSDKIVEKRKRQTYVGAYVVEPKKGIYDNIILFDFRSLYPSIITSYNIDCSTIDCKCCSNGEYISPTGHHFCTKRNGFIPEVLRSLIKRRMGVKKKLKEEKNPEKRNLLDVEQHALKLLANSMYGYFGFPRARWYSRECAEAIAALGRQYIHQTIEKAKENKFEVIYGDTDSVYLTLKGKKSKEEILRMANILLNKINRDLPEDMELEFEGFYSRGIFITKKRYALMDEHGMLTVKGLETKRRDWANIAKDTQERVLNALLKDNNPDEAANIVKEVVKRIKSGEVSLSELAINTQITRGLGEYVQPGPHIVAARKAMKKGFDFRQGSIVTYIITKKGGSISDKAEVIDFVEEGNYDADYYINNQVLPAVMRILEALGYSEDELKGLGKQMTLDSF